MVMADLYMGVVKRVYKLLKGYTINIPISVIIEVI